MMQYAIFKRNQYAQSKAPLASVAHPTVVLHVAQVYPAPTTSTATTCTCAVWLASPVGTTIRGTMGEPPHVVDGTV